MTPAVALRLLEELAPGEPPWVEHCRAVARVAGLMAARLPGLLDPDLVVASALLHDVGRTVTHGLWHPYEGWRLLRSLGQPGLARAAVTHWLKGRTRRRVLRISPGIDPVRIDEIYREERPRPMTWGDLVVSLADAMVAPGGIVPLAQRYGDLRARYGATPWLRDAERISRGERARLSRRAGVDLEALVLHTFQP